MPDITCSNSAEAKVFCEYNDRRVDKTEAKVEVFPVDLHRSRQLIKPRSCVRECASCQITHKRLHRRPLATQKVIDFRQHQTWNIARSSPIDGVAKEAVIGCIPDKIVD
jgi:hypothetical protein